MERQVSETVYSVFGMDAILEALDEDVIRPLTHHRYGAVIPMAKPPPPTLPKMILLTGAQGCGHSSICSVIANELRRGRSNKRGDVHYQNRQVKFLEWSLESDATLLAQIFTQAKAREFTVLTMPRFERICPAAGDRRVAPMKTALANGLDEMPQGKMLVVATTTRESSCDPEMIARMDFKYHLPYPDAIAREEIILGTLERENAELKPASLIDRVVHSTRHDFSVADLVHAIQGALREARSRRRQQQQNGMALPPTLSVISADWVKYVDLILEERMYNAARDVEEEEDEDEDEPPPPLVPQAPAPQPAARQRDLWGIPIEEREDEDIQVVRVVRFDPPRPHQVPQQEGGAVLEQLPQNNEERAQENLAARAPAQAAVGLGDIERGILQNVVERVGAELNNFRERVLNLNAQVNGEDNRPQAEEDVERFSGESSGEDGW